MAINTILIKNDDQAAFRVLSSALYGDTQITPELEVLVLHFSKYGNAMSRAVSFELAARRGLKTVRDAHVNSDWSSNTPDENSYEDWFGSTLLIEACVNDELSIEKLMGRISQEVWVESAHRLGADFIKPMSRVFFQHLRRGIEEIGEMPIPPIDLTLSSTDPVPFPIFSIDETDRGGERFPKQKSLSDIFGAGDDFHENQQSLHAIGNSFFAELNERDAKLLVQEITVENLQCLIDVVPALLPELVEIVEQARSAQFVWLKNLAFAVAELISVHQHDRAVALFRRAIASEGFLTLALGDDLTVEHKSVWGSSASGPMEALWRERLMCAKNDAILSREILAAERFGQSEFVKNLVLELASREDSLDQAYAATIASYSLQSNQLISIIEMHIGAEGIAGAAAKQAVASHQAAQWAQHWIEKMWDATTVEEFWCFLMVGKTCMDPRVPLRSKFGSRWANYASIVQNVRNAAIKVRTKEREKRLVGQETPDTIFIA